MTVKDLHFIHNRVDRIMLGGSWHSSRRYIYSEDDDKINDVIACRVVINSVFNDKDFSNFKSSIGDNARRYVNLLNEEYYEYMMVLKNYNANY